MCKFARIRPAAIWLGCVVAVMFPAQARSPEESSAVLSPRDVVERAGPAIVRIDTETHGEAMQGSGFLVASDGTVVTCLHVLDGATAVRILLPDETTFEEVTVLAFDVEQDLVVLRVDAGERTLPVVELGDTATIHPGDEILIIGNPLGLDQTVTEGIVSGWREPSPSLPFATRVLQISAAISPGSSGAPVLNRRAEAIGVATGGVLRGLADLNFATPIDGLGALLDENEAMDLETLHERADETRLDLAQPHFDLAETAHFRGELQEAMEHLDRALRIFERYGEALLLAGQVALDQGQLEQAEQHLLQAVTVDMNDPEAWFLLGSVYDRKAAARNEPAALEQAAGSFERVLDLDDRHAGAALGLATIEMARGQLDRAEQLLLTATETQPDLLDAHYLLGEIYLGRGSINEAKEAFERALWEDDDYALSHFGLARLYMITEHAQHGITTMQSSAPHHWEQFLELSEGDRALAEQRRIAIRILEQLLPSLLDR